MIQRHAQVVCHHADQGIFFLIKLHEFIVLAADHFGAFVYPLFQLFILLFHETLVFLSRFQGQAQGVFALALVGVDAVAERKRKKHDFERRTDLHGVQVLHHGNHIQRFQHAKKDAYHQATPSRKVKLSRCIAFGKVVYPQKQIVNRHQQQGHLREHQPLNFEVKRDQNYHENAGYQKDVGDAVEPPGGILCVQKVSRKNGGSDHC